MPHNFSSEELPAILTKVLGISYVDARELHRAYRKVMEEAARRGLSFRFPGLGWFDCEIKPPRPGKIPCLFTGVRYDVGRIYVRFVLTEGKSVELYAGSPMRSYFEGG